MSKTEELTLLAEALEAWKEAREGVLAELKNIPASQMLFIPTKGARSVARIVRHIIETSEMWSGELTNPKGDFTRKSFSGFIKDYASRNLQTCVKQELVRALKDSHRNGVKKIKRTGEIGMLQRIRRFDGDYGTRLAWMFHGVSHEEYHRAQLALYARLLGRTPALTRLIEGV